LRFCIRLRLGLGSRLGLSLGHGGTFRQLVNRLGLCDGFGDRLPLCEVARAVHAALRLGLGLSDWLWDGLRNGLGDGLGNGRPLREVARAVHPALGFWSRLGDGLPFQKLLATVHATLACH